MNGRWVQFLEVNGELSTRNLTVLITITVASVIVLWLAFMKDDKGATQLSEGIFAAYLLAGGGVYGVGKWQDDKTKRFAIDSTPQPAPVTTVQNANVVNATTDPAP